MIYVIRDLLFTHVTEIKYTYLLTIVRVHWSGLDEGGAWCSVCEESSWRAVRGKGKCGIKGESGGKESVKA